jgi:myo-inositol-1(or 4)-monophosphatase
LLEAGEPIVAAVLNPYAAELFTATRGGGAFLNQKPIHVSPIATLADSLVCTGFPPKHRRNSRNMNYYWEFTLRSHGVRRDGSAALDLCSVACGRFEAFWEFGLSSWDTAAGMLLVSEAGGTVTDLSGGPYHPGDAELLASNGHVHAEMQQVITEIAQNAKTL